MVQLGQDRDQWQALVNIPAPYKAVSQNVGATPGLRNMELRN